MRGLLGGAGLFVGAMFLQWWWNTHLSYWGAAPQFLLAFTILIAARRGAVPAMLAGFFWGLFLDVSRAELFGASALLLTLAGYLTGMMRKQLDLRDAGPLAATVAILTWAAFITHGLLGLVFTKSFEWGGWIPFFANPFLNAGAVIAASLAWEMRGER